MCAAVVGLLPSHGAGLTIPAQDDGFPRSLLFCRAPAMVLKCAGDFTNHSVCCHNLVRNSRQRVVVVDTCLVHIRTCVMAYTSPPLRLVVNVTPVLMPVPYLPMYTLDLVHD